MSEVVESFMARAETVTFHKKLSFLACFVYELLGILRFTNGCGVICYSLYPSPSFYLGLVLNGNEE